MLDTDRGCLRPPPGSSALCRSVQPPPCSTQDYAAKRILIQAAAVLSTRILSKNRHRHRCILIHPCICIIMKPRRLVRHSRHRRARSHPQPGTVAAAAGGARIRGDSSHALARHQGDRAGEALLGWRVPAGGRGCAPSHRPPSPRLRARSAEYLAGAVPVQQLVVLRTGPGQAQLLGLALDRARLAGGCRHHRRRRHDPGDCPRCASARTRSCEAPRQLAGGRECTDMVGV